MGLLDSLLKNISTQGTTALAKWAPNATAVEASKGRVSESNGRYSQPGYMPPGLGNREAEWRDIQKRQRDLFLGSDKADDPAEVFKANNTPKAKFEAEAKVKQEATDKQERADALGIATGALSSPEVREMTREAYDALDDRQRAAVDFNTLLINARDADLANQAKYKGLDGKGRAVYDEAAKNMFGKEEGTGRYAPETIATLRQLGLDESKVNLDDYLDLKVAINQHDLEYLGMNKNPRDKMEMGNMLPEVQSRSAYQGELADSTSALQQSLLKGNKMLKDFSSSAFQASDRAKEVANFGGVRDQAHEMAGFGNPYQMGPDGKFLLDEATGEKQLSLDGYFQTAFEKLSNKANWKDRDKILGVMQSELDPGQLDSFFQYADIRTNNEIQYGTQLGQTDAVKSISEYRKILGLDK